MAKSSNHFGLLDQEEELPGKPEPSSLRVVELVLAVLFIIAIILSLFLITGHGTLTVLSASALMLIYFYFGFSLFNGIPLRKIFKKEKYHGVKTSRIIGAIVTGVALSICLAGIMFKLMFWPGSRMMLRVGLLSLAPIFIICAIKSTQYKSNHYIKITTRVFIIGGLGLALYYLSWMNIKYRNHPTLIKAFADYDNYRTPESLEKLNEERRKAYGY